MMTEQYISKCWEALEPAIKKYCMSEFPNDWEDVMQKGKMDFKNTLFRMIGNGQPFPADLLKFAKSRCKKVGFLYICRKIFCKKNTATQK